VKEGRLRVEDGMTDRLATLVARGSTVLCGPNKVQLANLILVQETRKDEHVIYLAVELLRRLNAVRGDITVNIIAQQ
jgi:hypothetical protein